LGWGAGIYSKLLGKYLGDVPFELSTLRLTGVLVRIAIVYFAASLIVLHVPVRGQVVLALAMLLGYWILLRWTPNPHDPPANLTPEGNVVRVVDQAVIGPKHLYSDPTDPEGLLSDLPSIVTCLLGYWVALFIQRSGVNWNTVGRLAVLGALCAAIGWGWSYWLPMSKKLWTSSFVVFTGGLAMISLAGCLAVFDVAAWKRAARPFEIVGVNAIFVFVASGLAAITMRWTHIGGLGTHEWLYQQGFAEHIADPKLSSLAMALATVAFWWLVLWLMSLLKITVRV
jgi:predicted acyltransferase